MKNFCFSTDRRVFRHHLKIQSGFLGAKFFEQPKFCHTLQVEMKRKYSVETTITKTKDLLSVQYPSYNVNFQSEDEKNNIQAKTALESLLEAIDTVYVETPSGNLNIVYQIVLELKYGILLSLQNFHKELKIVLV